MGPSSYQPLLEVIRGETVESIHFGAIAAVDADGQLLAWYGDPDTVTFTRSSAKPFQALPFIESGGAEAYRLIPQEIALLCASHSGTDEHVQVLKSIQAKTRVKEEELLCGVHEPYHQPTAEAMRARGEQPTPNRNNCSGKHTGMLAYTRLLKLEPTPKITYVDMLHPIQQDILRAVAEISDIAADQIKLGIDGCSAPVFALPLRNAALAYARLCDPADLPPTRAAACRTIYAAMTAYPNMVGGPTSFDTRLMEAAEGRVLSKGGAEGFLAMGLPPGTLGRGSRGVGIVFKVADGDLSGRVRPAVALEILRQLGAASSPVFEKLVDYGPQFIVYNRRHLAVGRVRPCFSLERA